MKHQLPVWLGVAVGLLGGRVGFAQALLYEETFPYPGPSGSVSVGQAGWTNYIPNNPPRPVSFNARLEHLQAAGPARAIPLGKIEQPVAAAPDDADFARAAVWRIHLPPELDLGTDPLLRLHYVGDVARLLLNGQLVTDDFYNGKVWEIGLRRHAPEILTGDLRVAILPLREDAPIYLTDEARPDFGNADSIGALRRVEIVPRYRLEFTEP